jgi:tetratricopeptide (TPR) repeat protein
LGEALRERKPAEAVGFYRAALVTRPTLAEVHLEVGAALLRQGEGDEAIRACRKAIELQPTYGPYRLHLWLCFKATGRIDEALAEYQRAIQRDPNWSWNHHLLARCLQAVGRIDEAMAEYRRAIELDPKGAPAHYQLGKCWQHRGQLDEAMAEYRRAIELDPKGAPAHYELGTCWQDRGQFDEAVAEYRRATDGDPGGGMAHESLADALLRSGRFTEVRAAVRRAFDLLSAKDSHRPALQGKLKLCERMLALDARLSALINGKERPALDELLELARLCGDYGRPHAAAGLYAAAFASRPALADNLETGDRYYAACAAARAAAGEGPDGARLDGPQRSGLRRQALAWLQADLALKARLLERGKSVEWALTVWQGDTALTGVRDPAALAKLPAAECERWQRLWAEVAALRASEPLTPTGEGRTHAAHREWAQAAACYSRAVKGGPIEDGHVGFEYAALLLLSGDSPGYVKACAHMIERCGKDGGPRAYHVARACTLAPDAVAHALLPGRLAEKELQGSAREFWSLTEQGALAYRAGRFQQAVPLFEQSLRADPMSGRVLLNWLWLALAYQRLGQADEARRWLDKARVWLDQYAEGMPARADEQFGLHLHNWLEAHVLRREAEALISSEGPRRGTEDRDRRVVRK